MRVGATPENSLEWIFDQWGLVPRGMLDTFHGLVLARGVMIAVKFGVFDALGSGPRTGPEIAAETGTDAAALEKLLAILVSARYLSLREGKYGLKAHAKRFLLRSSPQSVADNILLRFLEWDVIQNLEHFVQSGQPFEIHDRMSAADWPIYQKGMKAAARLSVREIVQRTPLPAQPRRMLDIGGSHGLFSVEFCRKYPTLEAVVLDLPAAIEHAAPLLAEENMGVRVVQRTGDALTDDLGEQEWDFVFTSQLVHHFTNETNRELCRRVARALKPGGVFAIVELERSATPQSGGQNGTIFDFYFAATSRSGTWSAEEMQRWQTDAGLTAQTPIRLRWMPGITIIRATAP